MSQSPQTFANHTKWDPKFHFIGFPILLVNFIYRIVEMLSTEVNFETALDVAVAFTLLLVLFMVRIYALRVQDRVIRMEERLRLQQVLSEPLRSRIGELTEQQLVGLRFASDAELPALVEQTLANQWGVKDIKKAVQNWRGDYFRV